MHYGEYVTARMEVVVVYLNLCMYRRKPWKISFRTACKQRRSDQGISRTKLYILEAKQICYIKDESDHANPRSGAVCHPKFVEISSRVYTWLLH